jgi:hypothetical protein
VSLRTRLTLGVAAAVAIAVVAAAAWALLARRLCRVGQQRQLTRALHGRGDLALVAPAGTGDPARADLAALGHEPTQPDDVLVVDLLDLVLAVRAGLATAAAALQLVAPPRGGRLCSALLGHVVWKLRRSLEYRRGHAPRRQTRAQRRADAQPEAAREATL